MTDVILSSFISLFALFGKEEQVDEAWAKDMLVSYLRHHFGIRNIDIYLDLYSDMRGAYEMTEDLNTQGLLQLFVPVCMERFVQRRSLSCCCDSWSSAATMVWRLSACLQPWRRSSISPKHNLTTSMPMPPTSPRHMS